MGRADSRARFWWWVFAGNIALACLQAWSALKTVVSDGGVPWALGVAVMHGSLGLIARDRSRSFRSADKPLPVTASHSR